MNEISFRVEDAERDELVHRAERDKVSLSDYIRVRLGLRGQGPDESAGTEDLPLRERVADHERRIRALEAPAVLANGGSHAA